MNDEGTAVIGDFGNAEILAATCNSRTIKGAAARWMAPELISPEDFGFDLEHYQTSKESDVYALGMVIYEVFFHSQTAFFGYS